MSPPTEWIDPLVARYEAPLLRYAVSLGADAESARDIVQDTFIRLARQGEGGLDEARLAPWLFTVCRNRAFDLRRKERTMVPLPTTDSPATTSGDPSPAQSLQRKETAARLDALMERLSENQREVVRLRFQSDLSYREIAEITQLGEGNVGFLLHTALKKLRQLWPDASEEVSQ